MLIEGRDGDESRPKAGGSLGGFMRARIAVQLGCCLLLTVCALPPYAHAGDNKGDNKTVPANPVGAHGEWTQSVSKDPGVEGVELDKHQLALIQKVSLYFNQMSDFKGVFVQTSADNKRAHGKFYVKRPGRFRFDYGSPSKLVILSDGEYLAIQDHDLKTDDRVALDQTPFRVLMRKDVDLLRDAHILEVDDINDVIVLALEDKNPDNPGRIKLYLATKPELELREWVTTDNQGLDTRIELSEISKVDNLDPEMFTPPPVALERIRQQ
jgi:outer membrane lipoprotein-sorting protein